ncbi:MAG: cytochrome c oxidase subunit I [Chloroflexi bacterium]|nr:cytochrome c oxidase subunit I [Chloroflexota bacterium]
MATITYPEQRAQTQRPGILDWLTTVDHKKIGILYMVTAFLFFLIGGLMALVVRLELALPGAQFINAEQYNRTFSLHGTTMIFLFAVPMLAGIGNYLVPLQIGARDMAFPRLNALSYWLYIYGGLTIFASYMVANGVAQLGWTGYPPLSNAQYNPTVGADLWAIGLIIIGASSTMGAVNFVTTILNMRAPGMDLWKMPVFTWTVLVMAFMVLVATPMLSGALAMQLADRNLGTGFFDAQRGDPVLWQHLFWFYSHPAVYIMVLPAMGVVSEILPVFSRKPIFGYKAIVWSTIAIGALGFSTWAHHMFTSGLPRLLEAFFALSTMIIAVPTGVKMFNWIFTMMGGKLRLKTPMLFTIGFLGMFLIGGISGVFQAIMPLDRQLHDTYWVVAHLHYVLFGGTVFGLFAGFYYWIPKIFGFMLSDRIGKVHFWLTFIGFNLTFFPMHILGVLGMPRRYFDYPAGLGYDGYNLAATIGSFLIAFATLIFMYNVLYSGLRRDKEWAGDDPWEADTLEWATTSPPPDYNFERIPVVKSLRPVRDARMALKRSGASQD